jgi:hypothetical protein
MGLEVLVLSGAFRDESGSHGPGTYLKNPRSQAGAPVSEEGCTLLVKFGHLAPEDTETALVRTREVRWFPGMVDGLK